MDGNGNNTCPVDGAGHGFVYDVENRAITLGNGITNPPFRYSYAPGNKRVWRGLFTSGALMTDEVTFWGVNGEKLAVYQLTYTNTTTPPTAANWVWYATQTGTNYYFGRKLIKNTGGYIGADRLSSIGKFYPWVRRNHQLQPMVQRSLPAISEILRPASITRAIAIIILVRGDL